MNLFVLDTDTLTLFQEGHPKVRENVTARSEVVTANVSDFKRVPGLPIEDWSK